MMSCVTWTPADLDPSAGVARGRLSAMYRDIAYDLHPKKWTAYMAGWPCPNRSALGYLTPNEFEDLHSPETPATLS